jgi:hypothetical protein
MFGGPGHTLAGFADLVPEVDGSDEPEIHGQSGKTEVFSPRVRDCSLQPTANEIER